MDMNRAYLEIAKLCFPKATVVIDKYHVTRQAVWAFENVRKAEQKKFSDHRRKYFKRSRSLLNKHPSRLTEEDTDIVAVMLQCSSRLREAYYLKNKFQEFMWSKDSIEGRRKPTEWGMLAEFAKLPEFNACLTAVHNWDVYILNAFDCNYTNGFTEGCNNKTKVQARILGVRNFNRFRNRILHCSASAYIMCHRFYTIIT
jgi:transposase